MRLTLLLCALLVGPATAGAEPSPETPAEPAPSAASDDAKPAAQGDAWAEFMATLPPEPAAETAEALTPPATSGVGIPTEALGGRQWAVMGMAVFMLLGMLAVPKTRRLLIGRVLGERTLRGPHGVALRVRATQNLGAGQRVLALEVDGQRLLVGTSPGRMDVLHRWSPESDEVLPSAWDLDDDVEPLATGDYETLGDTLDSLDGALDAPADPLAGFSALDSLGVDAFDGFDGMEDPDWGAEADIAEPTASLETPASGDVADAPPAGLPRLRRATPSTAPLAADVAETADSLARRSAASIVAAVLSERQRPPAPRPPVRAEQLVRSWQRAPRVTPPAPQPAPPADELPWYLEGATPEEIARYRQTEEAPHPSPWGNAEPAPRRPARERAAAHSERPARHERAEELRPTGTSGRGARFVLLLMAALLLPTLLGADVAFAGPEGLDSALAGDTGGSTALRLLATLTLLAVAPALVLAMTSFTRLIVVFSLLRQAVGVQQAPPNQVLIGLALFLTWFVMGPTFQQVQDVAVEPYMAGELNEAEAVSNAMGPMRTFMLRNTRDKDLGLFLSLDRSVRPATREEVPSRVLVPAFLISELKTAFQIGFLLYIPFLVIDIVVATVLLAMGMMVLPPIIISLPFKLLLFVFVDGWNLLVGSLVTSFA